MSISETTRQNRLCAKATNKEKKEDTTKDWLRFAKDRCGGRKNRQKSRPINDQNVATVEPNNVPCP